MVLAVYDRVGEWGSEGGGRGRGEGIVKVVATPLMVVVAYEDDT